MGLESRILGSCVLAGKLQASGPHPLPLALSTSFQRPKVWGWGEVSEAFPLSSVASQEVVSANPSGTFQQGWEPFRANIPPPSQALGQQ